MHRTLLPLLIAAGLLVFGAHSAAAQDVIAPPNPASPRAVTQTSFSDGTYASIHYGSPRKRDREIFGAWCRSTRYGGWAPTKPRK